MSYRHYHRYVLLVQAGAALLLAAVATFLAKADGETTAGTVTYGRQIAPIFYANCTGCHHSGGSGPFPLMTYADAKRWGTTIRAVTQSHYMPPWLPEPGHGEFTGSRRLSPETVALIARWVDAGMPEGAAAEKPQAPVYTSAWQLGPPDLILTVDSGMQVPATGTDLFRNFILPFPLKDTKWIRAMEIKPGSPQVVHHANLMIDRPASLRRQHPHDWQAGIPGMDVVTDAGEGFDPDGHFLDWKPDSTALIEPEGMPWRLDPGNDLVLNMHLKPTGKVETVQAQIGLYFAKEAAVKQPILLQLEHDAALHIPAGDAHFIVEDELKLPVAVDVLAIYPHAHYLGKRLEGWAVLPGGKRTELILITNWDIDRQSIYRYQQPVRLPGGTVVHMRYSYDNSAANPHNPNTPPVLVTDGNRSIDEMGHLWLQVLPVQRPGSRQDAREPLLRAWMESVLRKNPGDATALFNLGSLDMNEGGFAEAVSLYQRALQARPGDARFTTALGSALEKTGQLSPAREQFRTAIAEDGNYTDARFDLAEVAFRLGDYTGSESGFRLLLQSDDTDAAAHAGLGSVLLATDRASEAKVQFEQAIRLNPANADALYNLAMIEAAAGTVAEATAHLQQAESLRPGDADTHRALVAVYGQAGRNGDAVREQKLVVQSAAAVADDWNDLGVLQARGGDRTGAAASFEKALALDARHSAARANLSRLQATP